MKDWVLGLASVRFAMSTGWADSASGVVASVGVQSDDSKRLQLWQSARVSLTELFARLPLVEALGHVTSTIARIQGHRPELGLPVELREIEYFLA